MDVRDPFVLAAANLRALSGGQQVAVIFHPDDRDDFDREYRATAERLGLAVVATENASLGGVELVLASSLESP